MVKANQIRYSHGETHWVIVLIKHKCCKKHSYSFIWIKIWKYTIKNFQEKKQYKKDQGRKCFCWSRGVREGKIWARCTWWTRKLMEGCLLSRLWVIAIIISAPDGGTKRDNLLNFFANAPAIYAGRYVDFKQVSRSYKD